jgi:outer membrane receptor protein involved in Fe transport
MKKLLILFFVNLPFILFAQERIKGMVTDSAGHPLDAVTIALSQQNNTTAYALADSGRFTINTNRSGSFTLTATLIGYNTVIKSVTLPKDTLLIIMEEAAKQLSLVTISAAKPIIERKIDRVVFNVENSIVASGVSVWDAVTKAPGVQLNSGNTLTADKKNVTVYVDDRPLQLSGDDLTTYLQGLPSDAVSKIEVITNPPAKYDAEGGAIINIISKKSKSQGLNVTLNSGYTQATYGSYNAGAIFNYRKDKLNVYGSYNYSNRDKEYKETDFVNYDTPGNISFWNSDVVNHRKSIVNNYKLGADYQLSKNQVIGFLVTGYDASGTGHSETNTTVAGAGKAKPDSLLQTITNSSTSTSQFGFNANYTLKIDTTGKSLTIDFDYLPFKSTNRQFLDNYSFLSDGNSASTSYHIYTPTAQNINIYSAKIDYTYQLFKRWTFTSGVKFSSIKTDNTFNYFNNAGTVPVLVSNLSDHFTYTENTGALYTSINGTAGNWTFQGGLRGEYTRSQGLSTTLDSLNSRRYFKLFPTVYLIYKLNENSDLQLTYSYRIQRPEYFRLNPFKTYVTPYSFVEGNPALQPSFVRNIELGYTWQKQYNITGYYSVTHDMFTYITVQDDVNHLLYTTQQNLGFSSNAGIRVSVRFNPADWWAINTTADFSRQTERSAYLQGSYDYHKLTFSGNIDQAFTIDKGAGLKAELNARYNTPLIAGIFDIARTYDVSFGIRKTIFHGGTLKLAAGDIFYGNSFNVSSHYLNQNNGSFMKGDTRNVTLSFTYKLGKNVKDARRRQTSNEDEKNRAR